MPLSSFPVCKEFHWNLHIVRKRLFQWTQDGVPARREDRLKFLNSAFAIIGTTKAWQTRNKSLVVRQGDVNPRAAISACRQSGYRKRCGGFYSSESASKFYSEYDEWG